METKNKKLDKAREDWDKAWKVWDKAREDLDKAWKVWDKAKEKSCSTHLNTNGKEI